LPTSSDRRTLQKTARFSRDIKKFPLPVQQEAFKIAQRLAVDVFDQELNIRHLAGFKGVYRVVVMQDYRMLFSFDAESVYLLRIGHRKDIYRRLEL
jgi:mRNA-degrading endonuclease RelE of RelBE toxin-antitoxin system